MSGERQIAWAAALSYSDGAPPAPASRGLSPSLAWQVLPGVALAARPPLSVESGPDGAWSLAVGRSDDAGCRVVARPGPVLAIERGPFGAAGGYVARSTAALWLAPDPLAAAALAGLPRVVDPVALHGYLCCSYVPAPHSIIAGVDAVPAGTGLTLSPSGEQHRPARRWEDRGSPIEEEEAAARLRHLLAEAVTQRLGGARTVGVFLSGGLDSALVTALLCTAGVSVRAYTLDFGPPWDAELPYARAVAAHLGVPLTAVPARGRDIARALEPAAAALAQPFGDAVTVPLWLLGQAAARDVDVVFNGEGGDQLFGGWTNKPMIAAALYGGPAPDEEAAYLATFHRFHGLTDELYTAAARARVADVDAGTWVRPALAGPGGLIHRLRAANIALKGAQNIAPRAAQLAAAHRLRLEMPFFDAALAGWSFTLPPELLLRGACEKYVLKLAAAPLLPEVVVWREKRGMGVPATDWLQGPLRKEATRRLAPDRLRRDGRLRPAAVAPLLRGEDQPGEYRRRRAGEKLWALLMLHTWLDVHGVTGEVSETGNLQHSPFPLSPRPAYGETSER